MLFCILLFFFGLSQSCSLENKYILYDVKIGEGFNLQKSVFVRVAQLVYDLNLEQSEKCSKTDCSECVNYILVLPPWCFLAHWRNLQMQSGQRPSEKWEEFFEIEKMKLLVPVIEFEEYEKQFGWQVDHVTTAKFWDFVFRDEKRKDNKRRHKAAKHEKCFKPREIEKIGKQFVVDFSGHCGSITSKTSGCIANYAYQPKDLGPVFVEQANKKHNNKWKSLYIKNADNLGIPMTNWWKFRELMVFSSSIRQIADNYVDKVLGGESYVALHVRRTDFLRAHADYVASTSAVEKRIRYLRKQLDIEKIFIMTDAKPDERKELLDLDKNIFMFDGSVDHPGKLAMVEQWIGVRALHFEGTQESRFSFAIWEERDRLEKNQDYKWWMLCNWYETGSEKCQRKGYNDFQKFKSESLRLLPEYHLDGNWKTEL